MATLQDIEQAIRNADAAGDGDAVLKLASVREQMLAQQKAVQQPPAAGPTLVARNDADRAMMREQGQRGAQSMLAGIEEGGQQLWAGLKQLGASAQDAYNFFVHGRPSRTEDVVTQPDGLRVRMHELMDSSAEKKVIAEEMQREQVAQEMDRDKGLDLSNRNFSAKATQLLASGAAPELLPGKATTMTGAMVRNAALGNASNAAMFDAEGGGLGDAAIASGAPAVLGVIPALAPAVKNYIGRAFQRVQSEGRTAARADAFASVMPKTAKTLTLAQRTGIPELITLERAATNSTMVKHFADQTDSFVGEFADLLRKPLKEGQTLSNDFVAARAQAEHNLKQFKIASNDNYEAGIKEARRIANEGGAGNVIPVSDFYNQMQDTFTKVRGLKERGYRKLSDMDNKFMANVERYFNNKNGQQNLTVQELADLMVDLNARQQSKSPLVRKFAGELREKLDGDLQRIEDTGTFEADDAVKTLLETRAEYRRAQHLIGELSDSAGYKLLGVTERDVSPDTVLSKFKGFTPEKRAEVRSFLEENSPDMLNTLKNAEVEAIVAKAGIKPGADSQQDLAQLVDRMFDPKTNDLRTSGLWSADELKRIEGVKEGLRTVANNRPNVGPAGTPIKPEDIAINAVSQHPAFLARALARVLMSVKGAQFFTDPQVYERLRVIDRSTSGGATNMLGRAALLDYLNTNYLEQEQK